MFEVPKQLQRRVIEVDGWLDLECHDRALEGLAPLLADPLARAVALTMRVRAMIGLKRPAEALKDLEELRAMPKEATSDLEPDWMDLSEAWCRKRVDDLPGAIACMEHLVSHSPHSAIGQFNLACYLALHGDHERALSALALSCGIDQKYRTAAATESDLVSLHGDPRYEALALPPDLD